MPGLRLTRPQAQRLWGLDEDTCTRILNTLVASGFLQRTKDGTYGRLEGEPPVSTRRRVGRSSLASNTPSIRRER
ncbi:MAG: hypothetical protein ACT4QD_23010 [Acidobacteriota bacterium]